MALLFLLLSLGVGAGLSARIVGFIAMGGSQYINMKHTLEELASRGNEVKYYTVLSNLHDDPTVYRPRLEKLFI